VQTYIHMLEVREEARNGGKGMEQNAPHVSYKERRRKNKASNHFFFTMLLLTCPACELQGAAQEKRR
jgi:hypothetical protein